MNVRELSCDDEWIFREQILIANLTLTDRKSRRRVISVDVITAGLDEARVAVGFGVIPRFAFKRLDEYMLERGFVQYKWERERADGTKKQVTRKIKVENYANTI